MSRTKTRRAHTRIWVVAMVAATVGEGAGAQQTVSGVLLSAADSQPIPFATIVLGDSARFANAEGQFSLRAPGTGTYRLQARQIGYSPVDTTITVVAGPNAVRLRLSPLALRLATVPVTARRNHGCVATGIPDRRASPRLAEVFDQLRENVDRYRLVLASYPFHFRRAEHHFVRIGNTEDSTSTFDTVAYESRARRPYVTGDVVYTDTDSHGKVVRKMNLPTFGELGDPAFLDTHCMAYRGTVRGEIRIDFEPANHIATPDVEGSVYLDASRYIARRAVFRLTRPDRLRPPVLAFTVTTTFTEVLPLVPIADSLTGEQPAGFARRFPSTTALTRVEMEEDRLIDHTPIVDDVSPPSPVVTQTAPVAKACAIPTAIDTTNILVYGTLVAQRARALGEAAGTRMLQAIQRAFHLPDKVALPVYANADDSDKGSTLLPTLTGEVAFTVDTGGHLSDVRVVTTSLSPVTDSVLVASLRQAAAARAFGRGIAGQFALSVSSVQPPVNAWSVTLARVTVPAWHLARKASIDPDAPLPPLPLGSGTFQFVVDEQGQPLPATLRVVGHAPDGFAWNVARALPQLRFRPAVIGSCPVKQVVIQPITVSRK